MAHLCNISSIKFSTPPKLELPVNAMPYQDIKIKFDPDEVQWLEFQRKYTRYQIIYLANKYKEVMIKVWMYGLA